eukprot:4815135-Prymnesium_polylepis.1
MPVTDCNLDPSSKQSVTYMRNTHTRITNGGLPMHECVYYTISIVITYQYETISSLRAYYPRRCGRTSLRFGQRPRSRQEFGASKRAMGRSATCTSFLIYVKKERLAPARAVFWATELQLYLAGHARRHRRIDVACRVC